jgi:protein-tyrosine phosphatase
LIDTHSHLLPLVDHGCPDMDTSLSMAREALASGIDTVVCTPHLSEMVPDDITMAKEVTAQLREELESAGIDLKLLLGFEVDLGLAATCKVEELRQLTIEGSPAAIVLEMPYEGWPHFLDETLFRLTTWGFQPVLAHPERNDRIQSSPELLLGCLKAGAVAQATAASLTGEFGRGPERAFHRLLALGSIGLLASDAHAYRTDGWTLDSVLESLRSTVREEELAVLVDKNPQRLLAGRTLLKVQPDESGRSWSRRPRRRKKP